MHHHRRKKWDHSLVVLPSEGEILEIPNSF